MGALLGVGNAGYTQIAGTGTTTINQQAFGQVQNPGAVYGANLVALGTAPVLTLLDIIQSGPGGTNTTTNTLFNGTGTAAGQNFQVGVPGVGVRYKGNLVAVTTATAPGTWNVLWD
jgi:hypothetical protein